MAEASEASFHGGRRHDEQFSQSVDVLLAGAPSPGDEPPRHEEAASEVVGGRLTGAVVRVEQVSTGVVDDVLVLVS